MASSETAIKVSRSLNNLHRDMRSPDPHTPSLLDSPDRESASLSPLDGQFVAHPLHLDLYNSTSLSPASNKQKLQNVTVPSSSIVDSEKNASRIYQHHRHQ